NRPHPFACSGKRAQGFALTWLRQHQAGEALLFRVMDDFFREQAEAAAEELRQHGTGATAETLLRPDWDERMIAVARDTIERLCFRGGLPSSTWPAGSASGTSARRHPTLSTRSG